MNSSVGVDSFLIRPNVIADLQEKVIKPTTDSPESREQDTVYYLKQYFYGSVFSLCESLKGIYLLKYEKSV